MAKATLKASELKGLSKPSKVKKAHGSVKSKASAPVGKSSDDSNKLRGAAPKLKKNTVGRPKKAASSISSKKRPVSVSSAVKSELLAQKAKSDAEKRASDQEAARNRRAERAAARLQDDGTAAAIAAVAKAEAAEAAAKGDFATFSPKLKSKPVPKKNSSPLQAKVNQLPEFEVRDHMGVPVDMATLVKDRGLVLFVYPKANTPGCTTQACNFRDSFEDFVKVGYNVCGISQDSPASQSSWRIKHALQYPLLCDDKGKGAPLLSALGVAKGASAVRSHFVFARGGALLDAAIGVSPAESCIRAANVSKANPQMGVPQSPTRSPTSPKKSGLSPTLKV
jgi:peroxiredoxin Q/BCP